MFTMMKSSAHKCFAIGTLVGLLDGLVFLFSFHSSFSFLTPLLLLLAFPCFAVALQLDGGSRFPDWVTWTAGVLTMALIGAAVGLIVHGLGICLQLDNPGVVQPAAGGESTRKPSGGG